MEYTVNISYIIEVADRFLEDIIYPDSIASGEWSYCHEAESAQDLAQKLGERFAQKILHSIEEGDQT